MKTDEIPFTFVTAIVLAGALLAVVSPHEAPATGVPALNAALTQAAASSDDMAAPSEPRPIAEVDFAE